MPFDVRFKTPFNMMVVGPSSSGKTTWVKNLLKLKTQLLSNPPAKTFLFFNMPQAIYGEMKDEGLIDEIYDNRTSFPTYDTLQAMVHPYKDAGGSLLIFDDMLTNLNVDFERVFLNMSHHENASVVLMSQNMFYKDKVYRTMSLNTHYIILMKNDRDKQQVSILAKQVCPSNSDFVVSSYSKATRHPWSYLVCDFRSDSPPTIRFRSKIFPHELPMSVYLENEK